MHFFFFCRIARLPNDCGIGGNFTICAAINNRGVLHRHATLGPYNSEHLLTFPGGLPDVLFEREQQNHQQAVQPVYVVVWDNVSFHRGVRIGMVQQQPAIHKSLPSTIQPFPQASRSVFSVWWWKVYDQNPYTRENLLPAMELACGDIGYRCCQGWVQHSRGYFPHCLARDSIACEVDEVLWPDPTQRYDAAAE